MSQENPGHREYVFFVDGKQCKNQDSSITGLAIKEAGGVPANYQLMEEGHGNDPDTQIGDSQVVSLEGGAKHFYGAPPATYGA